MTTETRESGSEILIYETYASDSDSDDAIELKPTHSKDIDTEAAVHEASLEAFLDPATRINESVQQKMARIRKEIKEIEKLGHQSESESLNKELYEALRPLNHSHAQREVVPSRSNTEEGTRPPIAPKMVPLEDFSKLESRIARLENILGSSARSSSGKLCVFDRLESLNQILNLLATDPERLKSQLTVSAQLINDSKENQEVTYQVNWLYKRLNSLEHALKILPSVASRLQTLRGLHSSAQSFSSSMEELLKVMSSLETDIKEWREVLHGLETRVESFISVSEANIAKVESGMYK